MQGRTRGRRTMAGIFGQKVGQSGRDAGGSVFGSKRSINVSRTASCHENFGGTGWTKHRRLKGGKNW